MTDNKTDELRAQGAVVAFLSSEEAFGGASVETVQTHISRVYLVGDRCYKLKRAVKFEFLDFSTLAKREAACRRELEINRRFAPGLYRGLVAVTREAGGHLAVGGEGRPVDWMVEMNRFDGDQQFDALAAHGEIRPAHITRFSEVLASLHRAAPASNEFGGLAAFRQTAENIAQSLRRADVSSIGETIADRWIDELSAWMAGNHSLMDGRRRHGFVRRCHGDLHLANIVLIDDQPTPFDAIEFSDDLSWIDTLYDFSFPLMDLIHWKHEALANSLLNRYLELVRDYHGLALLRGFLSLRAAIRAMACLFGDESQINRAADYMSLAREQLRPCGAPGLVAVGGLSGSGKSTLARALACEIERPPGAAILSSDAIRKRMCGVALGDRLDADGYSSEISDRVYRRLLIDARRATDAGWPVVLDATFLEPRSRHRLEQLAASLGVAFTGFWLEAETTVLQDRLAKRTGDVSDADFSIARQQMQTCDRPAGWSQIAASHDAETVLGQARKILKNALRENPRKP